MQLMLLRYHSRYAEFINQIIKQENINDFVFSSDVIFLETAEVSQKKRTIKENVWPESHEIIIKAVEDDVADKIYHIILNYKKEHKITTKLKVLFVPLSRYG